MDWRRFVLGSGAVLLCASLIAYAADRPNRKAAAPITKAASPRFTGTAAESTVAIPEMVAKNVQRETTGREPAHVADLTARPVTKDPRRALRGPQTVPPNDECQDAELVTGPYPVTVCGTSVGATIDCPDSLGQKAVWYEVTLPYAVNTLVADYCPNDYDLSSYSFGMVYYNDCTCGMPSYGTMEWHDCGDGTSNPLVRWYDLPGPATVLLPIHVSPPSDFCVTFNVTEVVTPANDACENAVPVTGPYPTTVCGTNIGATTDCPGSLYWNAVWYEVELPYALNNLAANYCPSETNFSSYYIAPSYLNSCGDCNAPVEGSYEWHECGDGKWNAVIWWNEIPGPTTILLPFYSSPASDFCAEINVTEAVPPANDACENAELVTGPYPTLVCGTTAGATIDCPGVLDWRAVWYEIELPYAVNTVVTDYCPSEIDMREDTVGIVYMDDCTCGQPVVGDYFWQDCGNLKYNPRVWWRDVPGPGTILIPVSVEPVHDFCMEVDVRNGACELECPPDGVAESETCGDDTNGGCNMATPAFEPLTCGETVCGTCWAENDLRDTDWYEITVTEPVTMTFTVEAEFITGVATGLVETNTPGVVGCDQLTGIITPWAAGGDCDTLTVTYDALPGTYWWFVGPDGGSGVPCGSRNRYIAAMTCEPWDVRGACCDDTTGTCTDDVLLQDCAPPMRFAQDTLCEDLSPPCGGCPESTIEIEIRTDRYPTETMWRITDHNDPTVVICSGGPYQDSYTTYFEYCCIGAEDCFDFTIYDRAGDGQSWFDGGYAVRLDGVELCSTLETSWSGYEDSCSSVGSGCDLGRCCYAPWPNCADTTLVDCVSLYGGRWDEGMSCADNPCQNPDAPNFEVVAPYTSPQRDTCDALDRCHPADQYGDTPEHVYLVTIPHDGVWSFNTCLDTTMPTWLAVGTSLCSEDIGWAGWSCGPGAEVVAYLTAGDYYADVEGNGDCGPYVFDVHEVSVCDVECPEDATPESEPCGDNTNNGCWGWPQTFEPITGGATICGTIYANNGADTDWFEYVATADDTMTWTVRSNFASHIGLAVQNVPGTPGCDNFAGWFDPSAYTSDCNDASISFPVTAGGTYYLFIEPQSYSGSPCGTTNDYVATLTGSICGDLDGDGDVDRADYEIFLAAFGGPVDGVPPQDGECDFDGSGAVGLADYAAWLACYRDYVGDPLAGPPPREGDPPVPPPAIEKKQNTLQAQPRLRSEVPRARRELSR